VLDTTTTSRLSKNTYKVASLGLEGMMGGGKAKNAENKKAEEMMPIIIMVREKKKKKLDLDLLQKRT
jgi:hypothetical protein